MPELPFSPVMASSERALPRVRKTDTENDHGFVSARFMV